MEKRPNLSGIGPDLVELGPVCNQPEFWARAGGQLKGVYGWPKGGSEHGPEGERSPPKSVTKLGLAESEPRTLYHATEADLVWCLWAVGSRCSTEAGLCEAESGQTFWRLPPARGEPKFVGGARVAL